MYSELYQYLLLYKELPVPGIGTLLLERKSAVIDFPNKKIDPPFYAVALTPGTYVPGKRFFNWLSQVLGITEREAIFRFNDFAFDIKKQISNGDQIEWNGVGKLSKGLTGDVKFIPSSGEMIFEKPVVAEKVIREKAEHIVRVGEERRTSAEMTEMLSRPEENRSYWWAYALVLALLAIMFIGWYFSEHGVDMFAVANTAKLVPAEAGGTYQMLP